MLWIFLKSFGTVILHRQNTVALNNASYKELLKAVTQNQERLRVTLTDEQKELLEKLLTASEEFANLIELDCFKVGFKLGARLTIEAYT